MAADRLRRCENAAVAEEVLSSTRHEVRNKLAAIANATRYVSAKLKNTELWTADPRMERFLSLIEKNVAEANTVMDSREPLERIFLFERTRVSVSDCVSDAVRHAMGGVGRQLDQNVSTACAVEADAAEVTLLISSLLRHVLDESPGDTAVLLTVSAQGPSHIAVSVSSSQPCAAGSEQSLALATARRICRRYGGVVALSPAGAELTATATLPAASPD